MKIYGWKFYWRSEPTRLFYFKRISHTFKSIGISTYALLIGSRLTIKWCVKQ